MPDAKFHPLVDALKPFVKNHDSFTGRHVAILAALQGTSQETRTVRGIAKLFQMPKPAVTRAADGLDRAGLISRKADPKDRRSVILSLTRAGEILLEMAA